MSILVCGARDYSDKKKVYEVLDMFLRFDNYIWYV